MNGVTIRETPLTEAVLETLIAFSRDWEAENSCHGYRANERADIEGMRVFLAEENGRVIGYLFGRPFRSEKASSIMPDGTPYFEIEELYVVPERRSRGVGRALMAAAEQAVKGEVEYIMLSTASKNWRAVLHFYIDEAGMEFWSARLFRKL
ncbi:MAG: GNAT family N-acetyltransferase [Clostridia bacterium]|nr:GNAT family N-acetyltransferase [Clostridia bacterium]